MEDKCMFESDVRLSVVHHVLSDVLLYRAVSCQAKDDTVFSSAYAPSVTNSRTVMP
jgi:hypothetical protein